VGGGKKTRKYGITRKESGDEAGGPSRLFFEKLHREEGRKPREGLEDLRGVTREIGSGIDRNRERQVGKGVGQGRTGAVLAVVRSESKVVRVGDSRWTMRTTLSDGTGHRRVWNKRMLAEFGRAERSTKP